MESKAYAELAERIRPVDEKVHIVELTDEEISELTRDQAQELVALFGSTTLMHLPQSESRYFDWLRSQDPAVWSDLWGGEDDPYLISLGYLPELLPNRRGFLICDLVDNPNYYFTTEDITREEGAAYCDAALELVKDGKPLTTEQAFVVEIWRAPIDLWRFAYNYHIPLAETKRIVQWLLDEGILSHNRTGRREPEETGAS
jgi:hypothetical protein